MYARKWYYLLAMKIFIWDYFDYLTCFFSRVYGVWKGFVLLSGEFVIKLNSA
jgi:hypothetical protein